MIKRFIPIGPAVILLWIAASPLYSESIDFRGHIRRLTFSGNNVIHFPCLSDDGRIMLYVVEIKGEEKTKKAIRVLNVEDGEERELFRSGEKRALAPFQDIPLIVGSKPPVLSGNGRVAVFSLSLGEPAHILDHYLAVVNTDGTNFWVIHFPIEALKGKDIKSLDFESDHWERVSNFTVNSEGNRIACLLKGYLGPRRYGNPSGIIFVDTLSKTLRTILAPNFIENEWKWSSFPCRPLLGGGWAFCMSGNGQRVVFGAQSSADKTDYDLYVVEWNGKKMRRITDFNDRWFSLADVSHDGEKVAFFYNGREKQGIGTYTVMTDGSGLKYLKSRVAPRVELFDMSGDGRYILFKHIYKGMILDLYTGLEGVAFDEDTPGYIKGLTPMDFPRLPAFWEAKITSFKGDKILIIGPPKGKETPEIYLLSIEIKK